MTSRQLLVTTDGLTQASSVMAVVRCSDAASGMSTRALLPLKDRALPNLPAVLQVAPPTSVPVLPLPDRSATVVPVPSLKPYAATRPGVVAGVVALATLEYGLRLPAASVARTR